MHVGECEVGGAAHTRRIGVCIQKKPNVVEQHKRKKAKKTKKVMYMSVCGGRQNPVLYCCTHCTVLYRAKFRTLLCSAAALSNLSGT